jgi:hypothetical protein
MRHRIGRRGAIILVFAAVYALFAVQLYPVDTERGIRLTYLYMIMPAQAWQVLWLLVAAFAASRAFSRNDASAFCVMETLATIWSVGQLVALILHSDYSAGAFAAIWAAAVILLRIVDGWPELPAGFAEPWPDVPAVAGVADPR